MDAPSEVEGAEWCTCWVPRHWAAATLGTDEDVVSDLEAFASRARPCGAVTIAVTALERGSDLTAAPARRTSLLLRAAELAGELGSLTVNPADNSQGDFELRAERRRR
jgi:hypothetical protein